MSFSTAFPPADDADQQEKEQYDAWWDSEESKRKDYDQ